MSAKQLNSLLLALGLAAPPLAAQPSPQATFRVRAEQVVVDLVVRDDQGGTVRDLTRRDIQILEDGRRQKLTHFSFVAADSDRDRTGSDTPVAFAAPGPEFSLVILLDMGTLQTRDLNRIKASLGQLLSPGTGAARIMVAALQSGLTLAQPFTSDSGAVAAAMEPLQATMDPGSTVGTFAEFARRMDEAFFQTTSQLGAASEIANRSRFFLDSVENRIRLLSESISVLARRLRPLPGRKHVLLFSAGYPLQPQAIVRDMIERRVPGGRTLTGAARQQLNAMLSSAGKVDIMEQLEEAINQSNGAQVSIYAVDPRGLATAARAGEASEAAAPTDEYVDLRREVLTSASHEFLQLLASRTGGRSLFNRNELDEGLRALHQDAAGFYLLAYRPNTRRKAGRVHKIEVKVGRSGAVLHYRRSYQEQDLEEELTADVMAAVAHTDLFQGEPLQIQSRQSQGELTVTTLIPTRALRFSDDGQTYLGTIEVFGFLFDEAGKWVGENILFSTGHQLKLNSEQRANLRNFANVTLSGKCPAPDPGTYTLIVVVRQRSDGSICTLRQPLSVS